MQINSLLSKAKKRFYPTVQYFLKLLEVIICLLFLVRLIETLLRLDNGHHSISFLAFIIALMNDLFLIVVLILPIFILSVFTCKIFKKIYSVYIFFFILINWGLTQFYLTSGFLLSDVIFQMSGSEIIHVISNEITFGRLLYFGCLLFIGVIAIVMLSIRLPRISPKIEYTILSLLLIPIIFIGLLSKSDIKNFDNEDYNFSQNKIIYLVSTMLTDSPKEEFDPNQIMNHITHFHQERSNQFTFISEKQPFLHNTPYQNVLGPYFTTSKNPPNVVLLIVESLSSFFCGEHAVYKNLMPFAESIIDSSLYWSNFLSNCPQTFGVLPNILGSLPYGTVERGFINMKSYPDHKSIVPLLNDNGYTTSFYYAGWLPFDNIDRFVKHQGFYKILGNKDQSILRSARRLRSPNSIAKWGLSEKQLFDSLLQNQNAPAVKPQFSTILTLTLHTPFNMCPMDYYNTTYIETRCQKQGVINEFRQEIPSKILSSIFYVDDALKYFFEQYKKQKEYSNTIFIITGDHGCWELNYRNALQRFQVPLIVYSPLLINHKKFQAISTHRDITPTLLALLEGNFGLSFPTTKQWTGMGLDTCSHFRSRNSDALSLYLPGFPSFLWNEFILFDHNVYKLDSTLNMMKISNPRIIRQVKDAEKEYKILNDYACKNEYLTL